MPPPPTPRPTPTAGQTIDNAAKAAGAAIDTAADKAGAAVSTAADKAANSVSHTEIDDQARRQRRQDRRRLTPASDGDEEGRGRWPRPFRYLGLAARRG